LRDDYEVRLRELDLMVLKSRRALPAFMAHVYSDRLGLLWQSSASMNLVRFRSDQISPWKARQNPTGGSVTCAINAGNALRDFNHQSSPVTDLVVIAQTAWDSKHECAKIYQTHDVQSQKPLPARAGFP